MYLISLGGAGADDKASTHSSVHDSSGAPNNRCSFTATQNVTSRGDDIDTYVYLLILLYYFLNSTDNSMC